MGPNKVLLAIRDLINAMEDKTDAYIAYIKEKDSKRKDLAKKILEIKSEKLRVLVKKIRKQYGKTN